MLFSAAKARDAAYDPRHLSLDALLIEGCGGFSRVELGIRARMWTLRRVGGLEATSSALRGASWRFSFWRLPQFTYAPRIRRRGGAIRGGAPQAAWPNCLTDVYSLLQWESRRFSKAFGRRDPDRRRLVSPIQHTPLVLLYLRRLLDVSCGGGRAEATAPGFAALGSRRYSPARLSSSGVWDAKIKRLRAMYKMGQITYTQLYAFSSAAKSRQN